MTKSLSNYLTNKTKNRGLSFDADFQNRPGSISLSLLHTKVAYTSFMNLCNQLPLRLPKMQDQKLLTLHWLSFPGWGRERIFLVFDSNGRQYIQNRHWCTDVNIFGLAVVCLNATINWTPENHNWRSEPIGLTEPGKTCGLTCTGLGLARQDAVGHIFGRVWV